jgi:hypothetical protein
MASISSMKMMQGALSLAYWNISRMTRADSPMYLSTIALATTFRNDAVTERLIARASSVFPVPGGPYSSTPLGVLMPTRLKSSGFVSGSSTTSRRALICSSRPPTDEYVTLPASSVLIVKITGSTSLGRIRITVRVVMSSATRVPVFRSSLGIDGLHATTYLGPELAFTMNRSSSSCRRISPTI